MAATETQRSASVSGAQDGSAYAGTHVSFDVKADAVANYSIGGDTALDSVKVQSASKVDGGIGVDVDLSTVTSIRGSALSMRASANAAATVSTQGSASMTAHDNDHGILVVKAGGSDQVVVANVSAGATAESESEHQVEVTTANGTKGAFIVVGNGSVTVNEDGDVSAKLEGDSRLVFRAYPDQKTEQDEQTEDGIASGKVTGEAYVEQQDGEMVADTVSYSENTSMTAKQSAENTVTVTVDRAREQGKIVVTSVSEAAVGTIQDIQVTVDGEAAARASSYSELESAIGGDNSKYMVEQSSSAEAKADVYVAVNHFSERTLQMTGSDTTQTTETGTTTAAETTAAEETTATGTTESADGGDGGESGGGAPGFGVAVTLVGVLGAGLYALRQ
ncbi:MAG: PGF-CTERM sorting domain-containing protein [Halobacterium sp.]